MKVKRSIYLIDPRFQLKFSGFVSSLVFIPSLLYPYTIYKIINLIASRIDSPEIVSNLQNQQGKLIFLLFLWQIAFTAMVFVVCIFQSHKIAGPMFKLKKYLSNIKAGNAPGHLFFRKGDNFQDIADDFNEAFTKIEDSHVSDFNYLNEVTSYLETLDNHLPDDKKAVLKDVTKKLVAIRDRYRQK